jgi:hypothetical protein
MLKKIFWFAIIAFVGWAFVAWLMSGDANLVEIARKLGALFNQGKEALGVFFEELLG